LPTQKREGVEQHGRRTCGKRGGPIAGGKKKFGGAEIRTEGLFGWNKKKGDGCGKTTGRGKCSGELSKKVLGCLLAQGLTEEWTVLHRGHSLKSRTSKGKKKKKRGNLRHSQPLCKRNRQEAKGEGRFSGKKRA